MTDRTAQMRRYADMSDQVAGYVCAILAKQEDPSDIETDLTVTMSLASNKAFRLVKIMRETPDLGEIMRGENRASSSE